MDHTALDFLAEGCIAGQTLLRLVARANAIIAEVRSWEEGGANGSWVWGLKRSSTFFLSSFFSFVFLFSIFYFLFSIFYFLFSLFSLH
jgi:hypothetical protein